MRSITEPDTIEAAVHENSKNAAQNTPVMRSSRLVSIGHGAPIRLRVARQLGYKHAKFIMSIEAVASFAGIGRGRGGFWEDAGSYEWYAGI